MTTILLLVGIFIMTIILWLLITPRDVGRTPPPTQLDWKREPPTQLDWKRANYNNNNLEQEIHEQELQMRYLQQKLNAQAKAEREYARHMQDWIAEGSKGLPPVHWDAGFGYHI